MKRQWVRLALVIAVMMLLAACGGGEGTTADDANDPLVAQGQELFQTGGASQVGCVTCHTLDGTDLVGPTLQRISERAGERTNLSAEAYLHESIVDPGAYLVDGYENVMNSNYDETLSDEEIDALVAYLMTQ